MGSNNEYEQQQFIRNLSLDEIIERYPLKENEIFKLKKIVNSMENNKYYVPEISEFHVGFEYEHNFIQGEWIKCVISKPVIVHDLDLPKIRVKYLDREDIESLGWINKYNEMFGEDKYQLNNYIITSVFKNDQVVDISLLPLFKGQGLSRVFRGTIKNKSELKKLMQQLNIK